MINNFFNIKDRAIEISNKNLFLFTLLFIFIGFFYDLSHYLILDMNEGLYSEVAREMLTIKSYVIPILNHVPYIEKPPLFYWLVMLSYKIFGVSTFAARLVPTISSALVSLFLVLLCRQNNYFRAGCCAGIIFSSSIFTAVIGRVVFFDMLLTAEITVAFHLFFFWYKTDNAKYLWGAYFVIALAFLTKGMIAICIAGGVSIMFMLLQRATSKKITAFFNLVGIAIFLAIVVPWVIAVSIKLPGFIWNYFINEQSYRFFNKRIPHDYHNGGFYYYIPRVFVYLFPWTLFIYPSKSGFLRRWLRRLRSSCMSLYIPVAYSSPPCRKPDFLGLFVPNPENLLVRGIPILFGRIRGKIVEQNPFKVFLWCWFLFTLLFFSLAADKGDCYMMVGTPPLAILLGLSLEKLLRENKYHVFAGLFYVLSGAGIVTSTYLLLI